MSYLSCKENAWITETRKEVSLVMAHSNWCNIISSFLILSRHYLKNKHDEIDNWYYRLGSGNNNDGDGDGGGRSTKKELRQDAISLRRERVLELTWPQPDSDICLLCWNKYFIWKNSICGSSIKLLFTLPRWLTLNNLVY